jgi:hypothetical protein
MTLKHWLKASIKDTYMKSSTTRRAQYMAVTGFFRLKRYQKIHPRYVIDDGIAKDMHELKFRTPFKKIKKSIYSLESSHGKIRDIPDIYYSECFRHKPKTTRELEVERIPLFRLTDTWIYPHDPYVGLC